MVAHKLIPYVFPAFETHSTLIFEIPPNSILVPSSPQLISRVDSLQNFTFLAGCHFKREIDELIGEKRVFTAGAGWFCEKVRQEAHASIKPVFGEVT
ncbi:hypothetical protein L596_029182 [Steinernema carpocapsae]|uniref:Uncharacterized protein n=1 Tax=Steinernema carpocapsae TaxID=34508 RepID=A0A4U5LTV7_STECR|nr:hypothetical protein L596_029182 [Steinernema carpocapsae]